MTTLAGGDHGIGAVVTFTGVVRSKGSDNPLMSMTLEHYPGMTETELARIVTEAEARWAIDAVSIVHRVGPMAPGEYIVFVGVGAAHRHAAFEAGAFIMDFLKTRAPFWKREVFADGTDTWVDARESDHAAAQRWLQKADA
jgi:molybdopterin synthase catalytic subunit